MTRIILLVSGQTGSKKTKAQKIVDNSIPMDINMLGCDLNWLAQAHCFHIKNSARVSAGQKSVV